MGKTRTKKTSEPLCGSLALSLSVVVSPRAFSCLFSFLAFFHTFVSFLCSLLFSRVPHQLLFSFPPSCPLSFLPCTVRCTVPFFSLPCLLPSLLTSLSSFLPSCVHSFVSFFVSLLLFSPLFPLFFPPSFPPLFPSLLISFFLSFCLSVFLSFFIRYPT